MYENVMKKWDYLIVVTSDRYCFENIIAISWSFEQRMFMFYLILKIIGSQNISKSRKQFGLISCFLVGGIEKLFLDRARNYFFRKSMRVLSLLSMITNCSLRV